jgi:cobalt-zinc-cadmium efflux system protein
MEHKHFHTTEEISQKLKLSILLNSIIIGVQVVGGLVANSLGLLSDAGHNFTDLGALVLSWFAVSQTAKPATFRKTFGYHRAGVLTALANSAALILLTVVIFYEAYLRILNPEPVAGALTFIVAAIAFAANMAIALILRASAKENINVKSSFLHMLGDAMVSLGVMVAAVIIIFTRLYIVDPIISMVIGVVIAYGAWQIIDESVHILLEGTPHGIHVDEVLKTLISIKGVRDIHDLHIWSLGSRVHALSCHVFVNDVKISDSVTILDAINATLLHDFGIGHTTIQLESSFCESNYLYCDLANHTKIPKEISHGHNH